MSSLGSAASSRRSTSSCTCAILVICQRSSPHGCIVIGVPLLSQGFPATQAGQLFGATVTFQRERQSHALAATVHQSQLSTQARPARCITDHKEIQRFQIPRKRQSEMSPSKTFLAFRAEQYSKLRRSDKPENTGHRFECDFARSLGH